ncbi:MAG: hypothetical protein QOG23_1467 [Blastocatellia bacterium]|jgi:hypothetical protein|nr:hypothetical protein [Blastocatellia bacterium]
MSDKLQEALNKYFSARSVAMSLARPFKAGERSMKYQRRVATREINGRFNRRYATRLANHVIPALKRGAKLIATLRVEGT